MNRETIKSALRRAHLFEPARRAVHSCRRIPNWFAQRKTYGDSVQAAHNSWRAHAQKYGVELDFKPRHTAIKRGQEIIKIAPKHEIYLCDMMQYFDHYFGAVESEVGGVVDYSRPRRHKLRKSGVSFEYPSLAESDESTEVYSESLELSAGEVVLDLGAYVGSSSYFFSRSVGSGGLVVAFEPDSENFQYLKRNTSTHDLKNVRIFNKGIWSENTTIPFQAEGNMGSSALAILGRNSNVQMVEVVTLDNALVLAGVSSVNAIKMDIEGAELTVLRSAESFLRRHLPRLVIEPHIVAGKMCTDEVRNILGNWGFSTKLVGQGANYDWPLIVAKPI